MDQVIYREFTIREAIEALEADAIPWTSGALHKVNTNGEVEKACAIGIMAVNLGVDARGLEDALNSVTPDHFASKIISANDGVGLKQAIKVAQTSRTDLDTKIKVKSHYYASVVQK